MSIFAAHKEQAGRACTHTHTHAPKLRILVTVQSSLFPTTTQKDMKSIIILPLFTRGSTGGPLTSMFIQHRTDWHAAPRSLYQKKRSCLFTSHFLLENINLRENHFQFASHNCKPFLNFYLECSSWNGLAFPRESEEALPNQAGEVIRCQLPGHLAQALKQDDGI